MKIWTKSNETFWTETAKKLTPAFLAIAANSN